MTVIFNKADRAKVAIRLKAYGLVVSEKRIDDVLANVGATFASDTLDNEIDYMIENFEVS